MIYIGIDPGFTGAIAYYWPQENFIELYDMPVYKNPKGKTELNLHELHHILKPETDEPCTAMIEQVSVWAKLRRYSDGCSGAQNTNAICNAVKVEITLWFKQR